MYARASFLSTEAVEVNHRDILFMHQLINYRDIDPDEKLFSNHLWYLPPETVGLSIFDDNNPRDVKVNIAQVMLDADKSEKEEEENILQQDGFFLYKH